MMDYEFHPDALIEFKSQIQYYEEKRCGLGADFSDEIFRTLDLLCGYADVGMPVEKNIRSMIVNRFPFVIYYEVLNDMLLVWAVMHGSREPGYWKTRRS